MDQRKASAPASWDGVPCVSPNVCIHNAVADELFDDVWRETVCLLEELLHKYCRMQHSGRSTEFKLTENICQSFLFHKFQEPQPGQCSINIGTR